ncbi:MAG: mannitol dehydrogenase [Clostridiales Family XIII bacterium]|jgi:mannitol-1-phosphate 5-dehydrogenase|nr:mannitol dehydrogenase [Clostridiales Family XIII bacterium]
MKKAVVFGAGGIGRGFVGAAFAASGYETVFVDVDAPLVDALNARGSYPVRVVSSECSLDEIITGVRAVDASDGAAASREVAGADAVATAVGVRALPHIAGVIADGLLRREAGPIDVIVCENKIDAAEGLRRMVRASLAERGADADGVLASAGFVETSIGRMVPVQTEAMKDGDPLRVCVEPYDVLLVDRDGFKGEIPQIRGLSPQGDFIYYHKRKLFVHNLGHAACAYLGLLAGHRTIAGAVGDAAIRDAAAGAMRESARALSDEYGGVVAGTASRDEGYGDMADASPAALEAHIQDLLARFANRALGDTCARVAADPARKLAPGDRLVGAADYCASRGLPHSHIAVATGAAYAELLRLRTEEESARKE